MAKYLIHAVPKRMWFVNEYIIPSMVAQGINPFDIKVYCDENKIGNLRACMESFLMVDDDDKGTWHIQDDVCICKDFKYLTEVYDNGLVCGFSSRLYDGPGRVGPVKIADMWFSFHCIRIPNQYARECSNWVTNYIIGNPVYKQYWKDGKNDDWAFRTYLRSFHKDDLALNIAPNLIDHVDYLLGGGTGGKRTEECRAQYFRDLDIVEELEKKVRKEHPEVE